MINISYAKADLEKVHGEIDEKMWAKIDALRNKDRDIGFLQDDFLYWKLLWFCSVLFLRKYVNSKRS